MKIKCLKNFRNAFITCKVENYYECLGIYKYGGHISLKIKDDSGNVGPVVIHYYSNRFDITQQQIDKLKIFS